MQHLADMGRLSLSPSSASDSPLSSDGVPHSFDFHSFVCGTKDVALESPYDVSHRSSSSSPHAPYSGVVNLSFPSPVYARPAILADFPQSFVPSATPSPVEESSFGDEPVQEADFALASPVPGVMYDSYHRHRPEAHPSLDTSLPHSNVLPRLLTLRTARLTISALGERRMSEPVITPTPRFFVDQDDASTRVSGPYSAHADLGERRNPFSTTPTRADGSWAQPVAYEVDPDGSDHAVIASSGAPGVRGGFGHDTTAYGGTPISSGARDPAGAAAPRSLPAYSDYLQDECFEMSSPVEQPPPGALAALDVPDSDHVSQLEATSTSGEEPLYRDDLDASRTYSFVPAGSMMKKRPRRRYEEIERLYRCTFILPNGQECTKAYGTLNHLNAHIQMQRHGNKRSPLEFKDMRKQWRKAKKQTEAHHVIAQHQEAYTAAMPCVADRGARPTLELQIPVAYAPSGPSPYTPVTPSHPYGSASDMAHGGTYSGSAAGYPFAAMPPATSNSYGVLPASHVLHTPVNETPGHQWSSLSYHASPGDHSAHPRPARPARSSWASDAHNADEGGPSEPSQYPGPPVPPAALPIAHSGYAPSTHFYYGPYAPQAAPRYSHNAVDMRTSPAYLVAPPPPLVVTPTQEDLDRFPLENTLLTPLPGYVPPSNSLLQESSSPPSTGYAGVDAGVDAEDNAHSVALVPGVWRRSDPAAAAYVPTHHLAH